MKVLHGITVKILVSTFMQETSNYLDHFIAEILVKKINLAVRQSAFTTN